MGASFSADLKHLLLIISVLGREMGSLLKFELKPGLSLEDCTSSGFGFFFLLTVMACFKPSIPTSFSYKPFHNSGEMLCLYKKVSLDWISDKLKLHDRSKNPPMHHWNSSFPRNLVENVVLIEHAMAKIPNTIDVSCYN